MSELINTPFSKLPQQLLVISAGDSQTLEIIAESDGVPHDVTGHDAWMTIKRSKAEPDSDALLRLETGQGLVIASPAEGQIFAAISAAQSAQLTPSQTLYFDLRLRAPDQQIYTAAEGRIFVRNPTTKTLD